MKADTMITITLPYWACNNLMPEAMEMRDCPHPKRSELGFTLMEAIQAGVRRYEERSKQPPVRHYTHDIQGMRDGDLTPEAVALLREEEGEGPPPSYEDGDMRPGLAFIEAIEDAIDNPEIVKEAWKATQGQRFRAMPSGSLTLRRRSAGTV